MRSSMPMTIKSFYTLSIVAFIVIADFINLDTLQQFLIDFPYMGITKLKSTLNRTIRQKMYEIAL